MKNQWPAFLLAFLLPLIGVFWWWGAFNTTTLDVVETGPYRYAYAEYTGDYTHLPQRQQEVLKNLERQGVEALDSLTILYDDPRTTPKKEQRARVGYLIGPDAQAHDPVQVAEIPRRRVLRAQVKAQPLMAPGKAYSALIEHLKEQGQELRLPSLELYKNGVLTVEMELPAR